MNLFRAKVCIDMVDKKLAQTGRYDIQCIFHISIDKAELYENSMSVKLLVIVIIDFKH